jgi:hypothetical protein
MKGIFPQTEHINTDKPAMNADDIKYILAEEGRYNILAEKEYYNIMNEGIEAIDIDEMNGEVSSSSEPVSSSSEPVSSDDDTKHSDYDDIKTRGGENYHINKQKTKPHSPKRERKQKKEKRDKDRPIKESRCHKKAIDL